MRRIVLGRKILVKVVFVCLGNICRSPTAEGVFRALVKSEGLDGKIACDSAGTGAWHVGEAPDKRMSATARKRGVDLSDLRARQAVSADFERFDYVIAMDQDNKANLSKICPPGMESKLFRFLEFTPQSGRREVPDPYYGGPDGFELVVDLIEEASRGLLADIRENYL
ncbi:MAG: low molecular weight phosphotyrosine protein phosphatase [Rhodospirillales bacterium]|jgi:protein-tyrosine phosphatase|nr:low molecular weight phosphotyrosine protein phosphatase [Rhodospirillales bacterium]